MDSQNEDKKKENSSPKTAEPPKKGSFAEIAERNRQIQERLKKEREEANKSLVRRWRLKK